MVKVFGAAKRRHAHEHDRRPVLRLAPRENDDVELTIRIVVCGSGVLWDQQRNGLPSAHQHRSVLPDPGLASRPDGLQEFLL